ncbi:hypothetical protein EBS02_01865 [bacterium]|nr:hypothetical protein [bacterium]
MEFDKETDIVYADTIDYINRALYQHNPLALAASLVTLGLAIYRTTLSDEEYEKICTAIYDTRFRIKKL